jgi:hypothetical protein
MLKDKVATSYYYNREYVVRNLTREEDYSLDCLRFVGHRAEAIHRLSVLVQ